jgi:hypothetical protein
VRQTSSATEVGFVGIATPIRIKEVKMGLRGPMSTQQKADRPMWSKDHPRTISVKCSKCGHKLTEINWNSEWTSWICDNSECSEWHSPQGGRRIKEIAQGPCIKCHMTVPVPVHRVVRGERIGSCMYCGRPVNLDNELKVSHGE